MLRINQRGYVPILGIVLLLVIGVVSFKIFDDQVLAPRISTQSKPNPLVSAPVTFGTNSVSAADEQQRVTKYLTVESALLGIADSASLYYQDLSNSAQFSIEPTKSWIPASTIKTFVVLEAFRQRDLGLINFNNSVTITADNVVPTELETNDFPKLREGTTATIGQLVGAMIEQSDNTAYNTLLDVLDRRNINASLRNIGITETVVGEKLNLDDNQFQQDLQVAGRQPNTTTAKDLATFFDLLYNHKIADADEILNIFKQQKINNMIPAYLPPATEVAHKTGDWAPIYHDGGVVYKPENPFILTVFTNSGDPSYIAQLAKVAYYQTDDSIGQPTSFNTQTQSTLADNSPYQDLTLGASPAQEQVLAAETTADQKFPTITAGDLGITSQDLTISPKAVINFAGALITPGSLIYQLKTFIQQKQLNLSFTNQDKVQADLNLAQDRLSEVKTILSSGKTTDVSSLLNESENYLNQATQLAQNDPNKDLLEVKIKEVNDLHFAVLNQESNLVTNSSDKEQFINTVYNFYQQNHQQVAPVINNSVIANPLQQKPAIGTITQVQGSNATIQFDDGTSKQMILPNTTKVRDFGQTSYQDVSSLTQGDKVAVVGLTNQDSKIIPEFVLKNVPKELPSEHTGTIIEINPDQNTIKILDQQGQQELIKVDQNTNIQSRDTSVSLDGMTVGSVITAFGINQPASNAKTNVSSSSAVLTTATNTAIPVANPSATPLASIFPLGSSNPLIKKPNASASPLASIKPGTQLSSPKPGSKATPVPTTPVIKATTVTVTVNGSGKNEVATPKKPTPAAPAPKPNIAPTPARATSTPPKPANSKSGK